MTWKGIVGKRFLPSEFDAYVRSLGPPPAWVQFCVLHNTWKPSLADRPKGFNSASMSALADYYQHVQGWSAGPHLFVDQVGIWVFTSLLETGVHSPSWNRQSWGVEQLGNYDSDVYDTGQGAKVRNNAIAALAALHLWAKLDSSSLKFHKEDPGTKHKNCPGVHCVKEDVVSRLHLEISRLRSQQVRAGSGPAGS